MINRFEVNNLLSGALVIWAVAMGGAQGRKPGTLFSRYVTFGSIYVKCVGHTSVKHHHNLVQVTIQMKGSLRCSTLYD